MEIRPEFTVIAGANGAGKSRLSPYYLHCKSFDGDLLALNLRKEHPDWIERWISGTVASELQKQKDEAIAQHKDFAFETNFSNDLILNMIGEFKEAGYKISLLYFGLGSLEESTTRVMQRKLFGGHEPLKALYLYGSYSKGNQTEDSDIDIAVLVERMSDDYFEDTPLLWKLKRKISNLIEPVLLTEDTNNPLYADILKTGILI